MPVGTAGSVKAVKQDELVDKVKAQIILGNTYHLYLRPGCEILSDAGGLHAFINWEKPILISKPGVDDKDAAIFPKKINGIHGQKNQQCD